MFTKENDNVTSWFVVIVIVGLLIGLLLGYSFMGPSAEAIKAATKYPSLYADRLNERSWTMSSTIATGLVWTATAIAAVFFNMKRKSLLMLSEIHRMIQNSTVSSEEQM